MIEYFQSQIDKNSEKEEFKLFYLIESGGFPDELLLEMKSIDSDELSTFDFSNFELVRIGPTTSGISLPVFKIIK